MEPAQNNETKFLDKVGLQQVCDGLKSIMDDKISQIKVTNPTVILTRAEYEALPSYDPNTIYYITD